LRGRWPLPASPQDARFRSSCQRDEVQNGRTFFADPDTPEMDLCPEWQLNPTASRLVEFVNRVARVRADRAVTIGFSDTITDAGFPAGLVSVRPATLGCWYQLYDRSTVPRFAAAPSAKTDFTSLADVSRVTLQGSASRVATPSARVDTAGIAYRPCRPAASFVAHADAANVRWDYTRVVMR